MNNGANSPSLRTGHRIEPEGLLMAETIARVTALFHDAYADMLVPAHGEVSEEDADRVASFLIEAFPPDGENYRTHAHLQLTGEFPPRIGQRMGMNAHEFRVLGLLHDAGRLLTHPTGKANPHRYFRNDLLGATLLRKLNIPESLSKKLQPEASYLEPKNYANIDSFTPEQRIVILADICGKRKDDGSIQTFAETLKYHYASRGKFAALPSSPWPSQNAAQSTLSPETVDQWGVLYQDIAAWLKEEHAIDIEDVRTDIETCEASARVSTLIWDVGGVLIPDTDPAIIHDFCQTLSVDEETLKAAWADLIPKLQTGEITDDEFFDVLGKKINRDIPPDQRNLFMRSFKTEIFPEMQALLQSLKQKGYKLCALSDTIPQHAEMAEAAGVYDAFDRVCLSPEIRCSKRSGSALQGNSALAAFRVACLRMKALPQECMFLDDKAHYVDLARGAAMKAAQVRTHAEALHALKAVDVQH